MSYMSDLLEVGDNVLYVDDDQFSSDLGKEFTGTVMATDLGNGWTEPKVRVRWHDRMAPTWMRMSRLSRIA